MSTSPNGKLLDEWLGDEWCRIRIDAKIVIESCRQLFNEVRLVARTPWRCRGGAKMDADRTDEAELTIEEAGKKTRRKWTTAEKRQIAQQALRSGAVLKDVSQRRGIHPSLLYTWRRQYRAGSAAIRRTAPKRTMLLPVEGAQKYRAPRATLPQDVGSRTAALSASRSFYLFVASCLRLQL